MGGKRSGRTGWRVKCEGLPSIDVRQWDREGLLNGPEHFKLQLGVGMRDAISVHVYPSQGRIDIGYAKDGRAYHHGVNLVSTRCHFGGERTWFVCPLSACGRRTAKLYLGLNHFGCRRCYNLSYISQSASARDRALMQAAKIRRRLGGQEAIAFEFPDKPPRMRWRTYERLRSRSEHYEAIALASMVPHADRSAT